MRAIHYLNTVLTILAVLLAAQLWTSWTTGPDMTRSAAARDGIPDAGAQRKMIIDELKLLNTKVDKLDQLLVSGKVRVRATVESAEEEQRQRPSR
jgi:hypothetical protein